MVMDVADCRKGDMMQDVTLMSVAEVMLRLMP